MGIDKTKIKRQKMEPDKRKSVRISIRVTPEQSKFMKDNEISPTGLFVEALKEVGYKQA